MTHSINNPVTVELNIGLVASNMFPEYARKRVITELNTATRMQIPYITVGILCELESIGGEIIGHSVHESDTEPTLYVKVAFKSFSHLTKSNLYALAQRYAQDCIAVRYCNGSGELIGEYRNHWGEFNANYFVGGNVLQH